MKSTGVKQGYTIVAGLFEICKSTETRLKLIKMDNSLHMYMYITVRKNQRNLSNFMPNSAKKLPMNTIIYIKKQRSKSHIFGSLPLQHRHPPWYKTPLPHNVYYGDTRVWYQLRLVSRGRRTVFHKNILFLVDGKKLPYWPPKISKIIPNSEIHVVLPDTDDPLLLLLLAVKKKQIHFAYIRR